MFILLFFFLSSFAKLLGLKGSKTAVKGKFIRNITNSDLQGIGDYAHAQFFSPSQGSALTLLPKPGRAGWWKIEIQITHYL